MGDAGVAASSSRDATTMRDVNADACAVDRALASASARARAVEREQSALAEECARATSRAVELAASGEAAGALEHERRAATKLVNERYARLMKLADERVRLAQSTYDLVDEHITRLDRDLSAFERDVAAQAGRRADGFRNDAFRGDAFGDYGGTGTYDDSPSVANPNEPTYCVCRQVSFGEMIACEQDDCPIEWYHFGCVGLKTQPKGKWICPQCKRKEAASGSKR